MALIIKPEAPAIPKIESFVDQIKKINTEMYTMLKIKHTQAYRQIWNNPFYSPAEMIGQFGTDGVALFQLSSGIQQVLKGADPDYVVLQPTDYDITPNADGTVTIAKKVVDAPVSA